MENIEFNYCFNCENNVTEIRTIRKEENGFKCNEICEAFFDFMRAIGFSEEIVKKTLNE